MSEAVVIAPRPRAALESKPRVELRRPIERGKLLVTADMRPVDEDLRHRAPAKGAGDHLLSQRRVAAHIDLDEGLAFAVEQPLGRVAIAAKGGGVEDDPAHSLADVFLADVPLLGSPIYASSRPLSRSRRLERQGGRLDGARQGKHIDAGGACALQRSRACLGRGAGGDDIVDQKDALAAELGAVAPHPEGAGDILAPLRRREPHLAFGALDAREQEAVDRNAACLPTSCASIADWLKRRDQSLAR